MGSDVKKGYGAVGRQDLPVFEPEKLVLVTDTKHPLYDERVKLAVPEWLVRSILKYGVKVPIRVRKNGEDPTGEPIVEVVAGRQRVKAALEANRRLAEEGSDRRIRVPAIPDRGDDRLMTELMVLENEQRQEDDPVVKAKKMQRMLDHGASKEEVAELFGGISTQTVDNVLALLDCSAKVQRAVTAGSVPVLAARELAKLPREKQDEALADVKTATANGGSAIEKAREIRAEQTGAQLVKKSKLLSRKVLTRLVTEIESERHAVDLTDEEKTAYQVAQELVSLFMGGEIKDVKNKVLKDVLKRALE